MKDVIEIKPTGSYFDVDSEGYLTNPASLDKIQDEWKGLIEAIIEKQKENFGDKLVSVYVRGSVGKGEAVRGVSDIDSFSYVDLPQKEIDKELVKVSEKELQRKFSFAQHVEMETDSVKYVEDDQFWIAQSALVYGKNLQTKRFKIGRDIIFHLKNPDKTERVKKLFGEVLETSEVCVWLCKQILRSGIELCYERSNKYSRDIYRYWETFSEYYPDKKDDMEEVLNLVLNPISDKDKIISISEYWGKWFAEEKNNLGY